MLIGVATVLIGALPDYSAIGIAAPVILVLLRLAQGIGVGGEWGGAVLLSSEFGDPNKRGFWSSAAQIGPPAGNLMANGVLAVLAASLSTEAFLSWGWRVAFLASALLVVFGLIIRLKLEETPVFKAIAAHGEPAEGPHQGSLHHRAPRAGRSRPVPRLPGRSLLAVHRVRGRLRHQGTGHDHRQRAGRHP